MELQGRNLSLRKRGEDVRLLQEELQQLGFAIADTLGLFGATTRQAVREFQRQNDLEPTGVVDEQTAAVINREVDRQQRPKPFVVKGTVRHVDGKPFSNGLVRASAGRTVPEQIGWRDRP
jgi:peptidoglycan hydrolase-like protein with peptidoglycan-binding domain